MSEIEVFLKDWDELSFEYKNLEVVIESCWKMQEKSSKEKIKIIFAISECK